MTDCAGHYPCPKGYYSIPVDVVYPCAPECQIHGLQGHFPEAEKDPVIQIASMVTEQGKQKPTVRNVMTLKSCAAIVGAEVMSFESEAELLKVRATCCCVRASVPFLMGQGQACVTWSLLHLHAVLNRAPIAATSTSSELCNTCRGEYIIIFNNRGARAR